MEAKEKQYHKMVQLLLDNDYADGDIKRLMRAEYHKGVDEAWRQWSDGKIQKGKQEWFKKAWDYGWPVIPTYDKLHKYILKEAGCYELKKRFDEMLKPNPKNCDQPTSYDIELKMGNAISIALAFGYVIGELAEATDREPFEHLKQVIFENKLLPYLPRERRVT